MNQTRTTIFTAIAKYHVNRVVVVAFVVLTSLVGGHRAAAGDRLFTPRDVARLKQVGSAAVSPSGELVAYTLSVPRIPLQDVDGRAHTELHVVDAAGESRPFITGAVSIGSIQWTPDGSSIAYLAKRGDDKFTSLYTLPIGGGESKRLIKHEANIAGVSFSADGQRVAFLAKEAVGKPLQEYREKGFDQEIYEEDWQATKVWIADEGGSGKPRALELPGSAFYVEWNPDGRQLVVVLAPTPLVDDSYMAKRVHVVDADTGRIVERIKNPGKLGQVSWSLNGKYLAMVSAVDINDPREGHLMVAEVPGDGQLRDLMPDYQAHVDSFAWQDDNTLKWIASERQSSVIGSVTLEGESETSGDLAAVLGGLTLSRDGRVAAVVGHHPHHPREVFLVTDEESSKLTNSNPWLEEMRFAPQEVVRWQARDGLELEGILIQPLNFVAGRRYPLIMTVHGGPEAHVANGWVTSYSYPGQVAAARGFAVFYPNYRGSTGRGVAFSKLGQADAAGKEFDDLVDGIDHLIKLGLVDKDKVGITGGSYGGYAAAWGATFYSERFAASVMFVGISDNVSKVGTTDIPQEMFHVHHLKYLWDDWEYFRDRSPIRHVKNNRTPTLILHGKNDPRVHPSQSLELFRHLKTLQQAPVRLVLYEGEGHGNRKAAARFDYNLRMLRWMEHYLQGPGDDVPDRELDYKQALGVISGD
jgi:dipeptidyl aminopeptidase/acylaminoacyl peptidase